MKNTPINIKEMIKNNLYGWKNKSRITGIRKRLLVAIAETCEVKCRCINASTLKSHP
jgi:hypothetical protein